MNRPQKENYESHYFELPYEYVVDLEKYCDELEKDIASLKSIISEMEEEKIRQADLELEEMYGDDW